MRWRATITTVLMVALLLSRPGFAASRPTEKDSSVGRDAGYGILAAVTNLVYLPLKLTYAIVGGVTGCLTWAVTLGNDDLAQAVWSPSMGGSYVVTPQMLRGEDELLFNGPSYDTE